MALSVTFLFEYETARERLNGFKPNSQRRRVWFLARRSLNVKIKGQTLRSPGTNFLPIENALHALTANDAIP